jgi:Tetratricopeptide repeat
MKGLFPLFLLLYVFLGVSCIAAEYQLTDEIAAYNQNDYRQVIGMGHLLAVQDPDNALVHYYLANSYSRLGQSADAQREYMLCERLAEDLQMRAYCEQALRYLHNKSVEDSATTTANRPTAAFFGDISYPDKSTRLIADAKNAILQEQADKSREAEQTAQRRIEDIQKQASQDIAAVPKYVYLTTNQRVRNPDYDLAVNRVNKSADNKIELVQEWLDKTQGDVQQFYAYKLDRLEQAIEGARSQRSEGITSLQLAPGAAQLYIKDYLHFEIAPMPGFPASALPGAEKKLKQASKSQFQS